MMSLIKNNVFKNIVDSGYEWTEKDSHNRDEFFKEYGAIFQLENIDSLTPEKFRAFWKDGYFHWGHGGSQNAGWLAKEEQWETTKKNLKIIVDESKSLSERIKNLRNSENGGKYFQNSTYTTILHMVDPQKHTTINDQTIDALDKLKLSSKNERKTEEWEYIPKLENTILKLCNEIQVDTWKIDWVWARFLESHSTQWWIISAGREEERETVWNEFRDSNTVGFYWNETGDLSKLNDDQIKKKFGQLQNDWGPGRDIKKIKKNDILFVKKGKRGFFGIGKATDSYQYNTAQSYHHTIPVTWITTQPYVTPDDVSLSLQLNSTLVRVPDKNQEPRLMKYYENAINGNYYVITQNPGSRYNDVEGKQYDYDSDKAHYKNFVEGTNCIVQSKIEDQYYFIGYGKIGTLEKQERTKDNGRKITDITAKYSQYTKFVKKKIRTDEINKKLLQIAFPNSGGNPQPPAMLKIPYSLYCEILGEDLTSKDNELDIMTDHSKTIEILKRKKNIILYGPPGTGKTYTAKKIANKLIDSNMPNTALCFTTDDGIDKIRRFQEFLKDHDNKLLWGVGWSPTRIDASSFPIKGFIYYRSEIIALAHITQISAKDKTTVEELKLRPERETYDADYKSFLHIDRLELCKPFPHTELKLIDKTKIMPERVQQFHYVEDFSKFINIVTFHQSYGYEEFIEGIRPEVKNKVLSYPIKKGIFQKICNQARNSKENYVLIIDEINRGNISKIFGELITIIENDKRGDEVTLAYSDDPFSVPDNVYIIGTMNTADQSLTHIDAALKRRFSSIEVMPDSSILKKGMQGLPELLDKINEKVREKISRDNQIGHSYFMQDGKPITEIKELQFIFATDIIPLLRDYFYDSDDDLKDVLGEQFIDWNEGSDRDVNKDWQNNSETFRTAIKEAYDVII